jgi:outer membrane protein
MKKTAMILALATLHLCAVDEKEGIVNYANCVNDSKLGKQEQASFETTRKQFFSLIEDTDKQIKELSAKLEDKEILEGLTPEAIKEMQDKEAQLKVEFEHYQQQYGHFISQGQYRFLQPIMAGAAKAAEKIAKENGYTKIANKDAYLYYAPSLDITADVVKEMDKLFEEEAKKQAEASPEKTDAKEPQATR